MVLRLDWRGDEVKRQFIAAAEAQMAERLAEPPEPEPDEEPVADEDPATDG